jgi:hypothetical protein
MSGATATSWFVHTLGGGGLLLLAAWAWTAWTRQPARRLRVAEWAMTASLALAVLSLGPAWLVLSLPAPAPAPVAPAPPVAEQPPTQFEERQAPALAPIQPPPMVAPLVLLPESLPPAPSPAQHKPEPPAAASASASAPTPPALPAAPSWQWNGDQVAALAVMLYLGCAANR